MPKNNEVYIRKSDIPEPVFALIRKTKEEIHGSDGKAVIVLLERYMALGKLVMTSPFTISHYDRDEMIKDFATIGVTVKTDETTTEPIEA